MTPEWIAACSWGALLPSLLQIKLPKKTKKSTETFFYPHKGDWTGDSLLLVHGAHATALSSLQSAMSQKRAGFMVYFSDSTKASCQFGNNFSSECTGGVGCVTGHLSQPPAALPRPCPMAKPTARSTTPGKMCLRMKSLDLQYASYLRTATRQQQTT